MILFVIFSLYCVFVILFIIFNFDYNQKNQIDYEYYKVNNSLFSKKIGENSTNFENHFVTYFVARNNENEFIVPSIIYDNLQSYTFGKTYFFTNEMCDDFMKKFDKRVYIAYESLIPKAYRSDLWRLCILYRYGGLYTDISLNITENIDYFKNYDFVLCEDTNKGDIYNALLYFKKPKHPLLKFWIEKIVENIEKKRYGSNALDITGPKCLGKLLLQKYPIQWKHGDIFFKKEKILFLQCKYYKKHILEPGYNTQIFHNNKVILERNRDYKNMKKYYSKQSKTNSYNDLWNKKKIYQ